MQNTGWAVIKKLNNSYRFLDCGTIVTTTKEALQDRLAKINTELSKAVEKYKIQTASIEETFVNKNNLSSLKLGHAKGAILLSLCLANIKATEYSAKQVKKSVVGAGAAGKKQVEAMVKMLVSNCQFNNDHEADAIAIAVCHGNSMGFNNYRNAV